MRTTHDMGLTLKATIHGNGFNDVPATQVEEWATQLFKIGAYQNALATAADNVIAANIRLLQAQRVGENDEMGAATIHLYTQLEILQSLRASGKVK